LFERATQAHYRLLSAVLDTLVIELGGKVALMAITHDMLKQAGATWEDSIDIVSYARSIDKVECGVLFTPVRGGGGVRVSMRSKGREIDAGAVCAHFGGGGHRGAAGCVLQGDMQDCRERITRALAGALGMDSE
jgi:phosphoesterase RecJ-like protein